MLKALTSKGRTNKRGRRPLSDSWPDAVNWSWNRFSIWRSPFSTSGRPAKVGEQQGIFSSISNYSRLAKIWQRNCYLKFLDLLATLDQILLSVDLKKVLSPRRLQSGVYLLNTVLVYCGGLLGPDQLGYLLRVSLGAMAHITGIFQNRNSVYPTYLRTLRAVRTTCFEILGRFYKRYESYPWSAVETEAVFKVMWNGWNIINIIAFTATYSQNVLLD